MCKCSVESCIGEGVYYHLKKPNSDLLDGHKLFANALIVIEEEGSSERIARRDTVTVLGVCS